MSKLAILAACQALAITSTLVLIGCGPAVNRPAHAPGPATMGQPAATALPAPAASLAQIMQRRPAAATLEQRGCDLVLGQHTLSEWNDVQLLPEWRDNSSPFAALAFAIYRFNLEGYAGPQTLQLSWSAAPQSDATIWIGFSDWSHNRWDWQAQSSNGFINLAPGNLVPYIEPETYDLLVSVVLSGESSASLAKVQIGASAQGAWWMEGHDPQHTRRSKYVGPQTNHLRWIYDAGDDLRGAPAIGSDGRIYLGTFRSDGNGPSKIQAINPDGTLHWSYGTDDRVGNSAALGPDGVVYAGSWDSNLYALNPDGSLRWSFACGDWVRSAPLVSTDGSVLIGSYDNNLYHLNLDGTLRWQFTAGDNVSSSPAQGVDGTLYFGSWDNNFYALNADGTLKWSFAGPNRFSSTPAIGPEGVIYAPCIDGNLYAITQDGGLLWTFPNFAHAPAIGADGTIYATADSNGLYAIHPDGTPQWNFNTGLIMRQAPTLGADGTIYVMNYHNGPGNALSRLLALRSDGTVLWSYLTHEEMTSGAIGADGVLYLGSNDNHLYAFGP